MQKKTYTHVFSAAFSSPHTVPTLAIGGVEGPAVPWADQVGWPQCQHLGLLSSWVQCQGGRLAGHRGHSFGRFLNRLMN